jgi:hypothetical protein
MVEQGDTHKLTNVFFSKLSNVALIFVAIIQPEEAGMVNDQSRGVDAKIVNILHGDTMVSSAPCKPLGQKEGTGDFLQQGMVSNLVKNKVWSQ